MNPWESCWPYLTNRFPMHRAEDGSLAPTPRGAALGPARRAQLLRESLTTTTLRSMSLHRLREGDTSSLLIDCESGTRSI
jgi:hypothetical protein